MVPAALAVAVGASVIVWQTIIAAPALSFGGPGAIYFKDSAVAAGSKPLLCFRAVEWKRLCPGLAYTKLTPVNVSDIKARPVDITPHAISTPLETGKLPEKCRGTEIPEGLAPGVWKLTGHASSSCRAWLPLVGAFDVTVYATLPDASVVIKAP